MKSKQGSQKNSGMLTFSHCGHRERGVWELWNLLAGKTSVYFSLFLKGIATDLSLYGSIHVHWNYHSCFLLSHTFFSPHLCSSQYEMVRPNKIWMKYAFLFLNKRIISAIKAIKHSVAQCFHPPMMPGVFLECIPQIPGEIPFQMFLLHRHHPQISGNFLGQSWQPI